MVDHVKSLFDDPLRLPHPRQIRPVHRAVEGRNRRLPGEADAAQGLCNGFEIAARGAYGHEGVGTPGQ